MYHATTAAIQTIAASVHKWKEVTMGDIADAMLDGDLCQCCGVYMEGGDGYPRSCGACQKDGGFNGGGGAAKMSCSVCGKRVKLAGISDHMRDKHAASPVNREGEPT